MGFSVCIKKGRGHPWREQLNTHQSIQRKRLTPTRHMAITRSRSRACIRLNRLSLALTVEFCIRWSPNILPRVPSVAGYRWSNIDNNLDIISDKHILIAWNLRWKIRTKPKFHFMFMIQASSLRILYKSYLYPDHIDWFNMKVSYGCSTSW